jgi:ATP-dependent protease ClpP protease subunit
LAGRINKTTLEDLHYFNVDYKSREIYINRSDNNSEDDDDIENRLSSMFIKNMRLLDQNPSPILIHLNAGGGGEWEQGMSIFDAIYYSKSYVTVLIYGYACSMSSIIPQAADLRIMMPNSYMMCHYGSEHVTGDHINNSRYFDFLKKMTAKMIDIYAEKMQYSKFIKDKKVKAPKDYACKFIKDQLDKGDWYLTAEEAVYYGLADNILGQNPYINIDSIKKDHD